MPSSAGKTFTAMSAVLTGAIASSKRVLWLAHRVELIDQAVETALQLAARGKKTFTIARFQRGELRSDEQADLVFATLPVLSVSRDEEMPNVRQLHEVHGRFNLIVVDECHHGVATVWSKVIKSIRAKSKDAKLLGLSATPLRGSDEESAALWRMFGRIIHVEPALELIEQGYLARPRAVIVQTHVVVKASKAEAEHFKRFRDLQTSLVKRIEGDRSRADLIVDTYAKQSKDFGKTLMFVATVEHAKALCRKFAARGIEAAQLTAQDDPAERRRVLERFKSKDLDVLINVMLFTEGTDLPLVQTVFVARPTRSRVLFQQMVGRAMRGPHLKGTKECIVVAFQDRITDLLEEQLASTFESEREALLALGIEQTTDEEQEPAPAQRRSAEPGCRSVERDLDELREWLANRRTQTVVGRPTHHELAGWWEVSDGHRTLRLPVFGDGRERVTAWVEAARIAPCPAPAETGIPGHVWAGFADAMAERGTDPRFVAIGTVRIADLEAFSEAPFGGDAPKPGFDWLAFAEASVTRPADTELFIAGPRVVAVPSSAVQALEASLHDLLAVDAGRETERAGAVRFAARQAARSAGLDDSLVEEVLHSAMAAGALQRPTSKKPTLREAGEILDRAKNRDDYKRALRTLHGSFFAGDYPDVVDLLAELRAEKANASGVG